ncbi:MAG TPA: hypothetical protein PLR60_02665 [Syntrophorhabdaceae bacterium]|nr:hypothetical protein [Syntrophorhabdaceae bacterium]
MTDKIAIAFFALFSFLSLFVIIICTSGVNPLNAAAFLGSIALVIIFFLYLIHLRRKNIDGFLVAYYPSVQEREHLCLPFHILPYMRMIGHSFFFTLFCFFLYMSIVKGTIQRFEVGFMVISLLLIDILFILLFIRKRLLAGAAIVDKRICIWKNVFNPLTQDVPLDTIEKVFVINTLYGSFLRISCTDGKKYHFSGIYNTREIHYRLKTEKDTNNYSMKIFPESPDTFLWERKDVNKN